MLSILLVPPDVFKHLDWPIISFLYLYKVILIFLNHLKSSICLISKQLRKIKAGLLNTLFIETAMGLNKINIKILKTLIMKPNWFVSTKKTSFNKDLKFFFRQKIVIILPLFLLLFSLFLRFFARIFLILPIVIIW